MSILDPAAGAANARLNPASSVHGRAGLFADERQAQRASG
jgi:hypothetical protein